MGKMANEKTLVFQSVASQDEQAAKGRNTSAASSRFEDAAAKKAGARQ